MGSVVQIVGALAILAAFGLAQFGVLGQRAWAFLLLNFGGSLVLAIDAYIERQWGFFLLEAAWALISGWGLVARGTGRLEVAH